MEPYSVCLASRNRRKQLEVTLPTILAQEPDDIVLVDDGSTDETGEWFSAYMKENCPGYAGDTSWWLHRNEHPGYRLNPAVPFNDAVALARNDWVVVQCAEVACMGFHVYDRLFDYLCQKDRWLNEIALARCHLVPLGFRFPESEDERDAYAGLDVQIPAGATPTWADPGLPANKVYCGHERPVPLLFCGAMHRKIWEKLGGYNEHIRAAADADFGCRALANGIKFQILGEAVTFHLAHGKL